MSREIKFRAWDNETKDLRQYWRLQGFPDWAFDRAKTAGLSDTQLYKQDGNSVTVPVIKAIADRMGLAV